VADRPSRDRPIGLALIILGILFLAGRLFNFSIGDLIWPGFILVPGVLLFFLMAAGDRTFAWLAIPASVLSMLGLLFFYQNTFDHFESWAYAWALIFPTSIGIGFMIIGTRTDNPDLQARGRGLIRAGATIFLIGAVFFELVIGISNAAVARYGMPILIIAAGLYLLLRRGRKTEGKPITNTEGESTAQNPASTQEGGEPPAPAGTF